MSSHEKIEMSELKVPLLEPESGSIHSEQSSTSSKSRQNSKIDRNRRRTAEDYKEAAKFLTVAETEPNAPLTKKLSDSNLMEMAKVQNTKRPSMPHKIHSRKLSQSRGVKLPAINITEAKKTSTTIAPHTAPASTSDERSPPLTSSPIGYMLRHSEANLEESTLEISFPPTQNPNSTEDIDIRIFYTNGKAVQFTVERGREAIAADLLQLMADYMQLDYEVVKEAFAIWLISPLLEVQLKPHHVAYEVREKWHALLKKFTTASKEDIVVDEPLLVMKRNVQLSMENEIQFQNDYEIVTDILYYDAKDEYMTGRYLVEVETAVQLAALQYAIDFEPYNPETMEIHGEHQEDIIENIREKLPDLVPAVHVNSIRSFHLFGLPVMECKKGWEQELVDEYKRASQMYQNNYFRKIAYLEILRASPFYGSAFFKGSTDRRGSLSLLDLGKKLFSSLPNRMEVLVGINHEFISVVDPQKHECLLVQRIADCSWMKINEVDDEIPSFLLHFPDEASLKASKVAYSNDEKVEIQNGRVPQVDEQGRITPPVSRLLQIFSKQAVMMEALLNALYELAVITSEMGSDDEDGIVAQFSGDENQPIHETSIPESTCTLPSMPSSHQSIHQATCDYPQKPRNGSMKFSNESLNKKSSSTIYQNRREALMHHLFSNKLNRLCLAKLDECGRCVEAHGTLRRMLMEVH